MKLEQITKQEPFTTTIPLSGIVCDEKVRWKQEMEYKHRGLAIVRDEVLETCDTNGNYDVHVSIGEEMMKFGGEIKKVVYSNYKSEWSEGWGWRDRETDRVEITFEEFQRLGRPKQLERVTVHTYTPSNE